MCVQLSRNLLSLSVIMADGLTHWQKKVMDLAQGHTVEEVRALSVQELKNIVSPGEASAAGAGAAAGGEVRPLRDNLAACCGGMSEGVRSQARQLRS
jgi:hypothetical protein